MDTRMAFAIGALAAMCSLVGCERSQAPTAPTPSPGDQAELSSIEDSAVEIMESRIGFQPKRGPERVSVEGLEQAVQSAGGLAYVVLKAPSAPRSVDAGGVRAAMSIQDVRQALEMLGRRSNVQILKYYRWLGIALVRVAPGAAAVVRASLSTDHVGAATRMVQMGSLARGRDPGTASSLRGPLQSVASGTQVTPWNVSQIHAPQAWPITTGVSTKVMMLFSGLKATDPDLPTIPEFNCGGYFGACGGAPYFNGINQLAIVTARDNSFGIVGVAPGLQGSNIYLWNPYSLESDTLWLIGDYGYYAGLNVAIQYGVRVIYTDVQHTGYDSTEASAYAQLNAHGILVVTGLIGNGQYISSAYPASYPNVLAVSGVNPSGVFAGPNTCSGWERGSGYGPMVNLSAPVSAYTIYGSGYSYEYYDQWNTYPGHICSASEAGAHVAAVAALLWDKNPTWSPAQITARLEATASGGGTRISDQYGYGVVNAYAAVYTPPPPLSSYIISNFPTFTMVPVGGVAPYTYYWEACVANCGLAAPSPSGGVGPNRPIQGWYFLSTSYTVTWSTHNSNLRCTVTDSDNQQSQSQVHVP